eukprot:GFUD01027208.1.p1 GENE.GFUD01027208.1~~GFUD01027208.1.p1  ORF type:complete len:305 (+),score=62.04 GFUD01027208.1:133-1047(+)
MRDISNMKILIQVLLCICYVKAQEGIYPIPVNELYGDFFNNSAGTGLGCNPKSVKNPREYETCLSETPFHTDYGCRYYKIFRPMCYCCGHYYHYIELADICTKFCLNSDTTKPKYGQERLITLPFNWGWETPDRITLGDGSEVAVPCDPLDGAAYGCNDQDSDGFRKPFSTDKKNENEKEVETGKIRIYPSTTSPPKRRTTTILKPPNIKSKITLKTSKDRTTTTTLKTTTALPEKLVRFSLTRNNGQNVILHSKKTSEPPRVWGSSFKTNKQSLTTKTTPKKTRIIPTQSQPTQMRGGLPVWG